MHKFIQILFYLSLFHQLNYAQDMQVVSENAGRKSSVYDLTLFSVTDTLGPELIINDDMELNTYWNAAWQPDSCLQSADIAHGGNFSWKTVTGSGSGIASSYSHPQLEVIEDSTYWVDAYVYVVSGAASIVVFTDTYHQLWTSAINGQWLHVSFSFVAENLTEPGLAYLYFLGNSGSTSTLYIDNVSVRQRITPTNQYIEVLSPNGGESWLAGSTQDSIWSSTNLFDVKIEWSTNSGMNWTTIVDSTSSNGIYSWVLPNIASTQNLIRISDKSNFSIYDTSDSLFTIEILVSANVENIPEYYALYQNYPNPFNPSTKIKYSIPQSLSLGERVSEGRVRAILKVYDILGNEVAELVDGEEQSGTYEVEFNGSNFSSGVYLYRLTAGSFRETKKLILIK